MGFRCILFLDTSESGILVESRCIWNVWFLEHTSEMPDLEPSRCTEAQIYLRNTSGWANTGYFRCIAYNCQNKIHRNSVIHSNPDVFKLISRDSTRFPSQCIPAQAGKNKQNTSEFINFYSQSKYACVLNYHYQCSGCNKDATDQRLGGKGFM